MLYVELLQYQHNLEIPSVCAQSLAVSFGLFLQYFAFMMATAFHRNTPNPLLIPEIVGLVVDNMHKVPDLLSCAGVNNIWNVVALKKLYRGSLNDMQFRTPDIGSLNCLLVASRERFARNMSFARHLLLCPETPTVDDAVDPNTRLACFEKFRAIRHREDAEHLLRPRGKGPTSLTIPFEMVDQDWSQISDLLLPPTVEFLAIDNYYCRLLMDTSNYSREVIAPAVSPIQLAVSLSETMTYSDRLGSQTLKLSQFTNQRAITAFMSFANCLKVVICNFSTLSIDPVLTVLPAQPKPTMRN